MATGQEWASAFARQARKDFATFDRLAPTPTPECHKLMFLQMACEKLVKSHLCSEGADPLSLQSSHAYVAQTLPIVFRQRMSLLGMSGRPARAFLRHVKHISAEIDVLAPAVKRGGKRPDNCEYPWQDANGRIIAPLEWSFYPTQLLTVPGGRTFLKLLKYSLDQSA